MKKRACLGLVIAAIVAGPPVLLAGEAEAGIGPGGAVLGAGMPRQEDLEWEAARPVGGAILDLTTVPVEPPRGEEPERPPQIVLGAGLGVWHTERGDAAWEMFPRPGRMNNVIAAPGGGIYIAGPEGAMRSTTGGRTWANTQVRRDQEVRFLAAPPDWDTDGAVYAITLADGRLYKVEKGRSSWAEIILVTGEEHWTGAVAFSPLHSDDETVFAGTDAGIFKSTNNGQRWTLVSDATGPVFGPEGGPPAAQGLVVSPDYGDDPSRLGDAEDDTLFAFNSAGLFRSDDDGATWRRLPLDVDRVNDLAVSTGWPYDETLMAAVADADGAVAAVSTDGGATWSRTPGPDGVAGTAVAMSVDYAPPYRGRPHNGIWLPMVVMESAVATGPGVQGPEGSREAFLATDGDGIWRTRDGGATWQRLIAGLEAVEVTALAMLPGGPDSRVLAGTSMTGLYVSDDGARTWAEAESGLPRGAAARINAVVPSPDFETDRTVLLAADDGVWRSQDGGTTWRQAQGAPAPVNTVALSPDFATDGRAMVPGAASTDGGISWQ
ncbi:MAG: WD40/YVTN/BNR-like repeat-containing protein, partial [Anaerolineae bacterium]